MPASAPDLRVTIDGKVYECSVTDALEDLTGEETLEVEAFLGGWENFDQSGESARSVILLYFLAKRSHEPKTRLSDILQEKGLLFGDRLTLEDLDEEDDASPPAEAPAEEGATPSTPSAPSDDSGAGT